MIHKNVQIHETAEINVKHLEIGAGSKIGARVVIEGTRVVIGQEAWLDQHAYIGGGSAFDPFSFLVAGDFLHMGRNSLINTARGVTIGNEVGCGVETKIVSHGAYLSELDGFPVQFEGITIGDRVWLPNAWVNPGVTIGSDAVVAARSLVNKDLPSNCLAAGVPCRVIRENCYPVKLTVDQKSVIVEQIISEAVKIHDGPLAVTSMLEPGQIKIFADCATFDLEDRSITGLVSGFSETMRNQLRRHGIRFRYSPVGGRYVKWEGDK